MATRAIISTVDVKDGKEIVKSIYLHHDGYLEGAGLDLYTRFNELSKVEWLLNQGSLSSLAITEIHNPSNYYNEKADVIENFFKIPEQEYNYMYMVDEAKWYYRHENDAKFGWKVLEEKLVKMNLI